jgi:hypothetical protein
VVVVVVVVVENVAVAFGAGSSVLVQETLWPLTPTADDEDDEAALGLRLADDDISSGSRLADEEAAVGLRSAHAVHPAAVRLQCVGFFFRAQWDTKQQTNKKKKRREKKS